MTGNGHVQFGGGLMEKGPCATSPAAYPTKPAILLNACAIIAAHNLCGAPHKLCYVASGIMYSSCRLTRLFLHETCKSTVSSCT
jgi:hypothetical protein